MPLRTMFCLQIMLSYLPTASRFPSRLASISAHDRRVGAALVIYEKKTQKTFTSSASTIGKSFT